MRMCVLLKCLLSAATPAPADALEKSGKEGEKDEDKEEGEAPSEKEKVKEKDEGKEVDNSKTGDPEEVGRCPRNTRNSTANTLLSSGFDWLVCTCISANL